MDKIYSPIKERILYYIDLKGIKKEGFFKKVDIMRSNFSGIGAKSEFGGDKIAKILNEYPDINPDWLITGRGEMLRNNVNISHVSGSVNQINGCKNIGSGDMSGNVINQSKVVMNPNDVKYLQQVVVEKDRVIEQKEQCIIKLRRKIEETHDEMVRRLDDMQARWDEQAKGKDNLINKMHDELFKLNNAIISMSEKVADLSVKNS
jgi:hypothetical protein